ncbi:PIG-L deacetylase family protein [Brachybacterium huguangmaarense]
MSGPMTDAMIPGAARVLVVAPHPDDEVLGCGATIARLAAHGAEVTVVAACADLPPLYGADVAPQVEAEARAAHAVLGVHRSVFLDLPSVEVSRGPVAVLNGGLQRVVDETRPELVLIPFPDRHVDHKAVFDAAMVVTRPIGAGTGIRTVAMYETVSETFWNAPGAEPAFVPTWSVDVTATIDAKIEAFGRFASQLQAFPGPRSVEALRALALFRGSQSSMPYAEAFQIARMTSPAGGCA